MSATLLSPQEFMNQLTVMLSGGDRFAQLAAEEFSRQMENYGSDAAFEKANQRLYRCFERIAHEPRDGLTGVRWLEHWANQSRFKNFEYISEAILVFEEKIENFQRLLAGYADVLESYPEIRDAGVTMLDALSACIALSTEQLALAGQNEQRGRA